ncbi:Protein of unknown function [Pyronema omphalodes CBS 100304]|uniref:Uncharacterized protein n=1 Tax=Pyronema omphalodes (strain CBS 100304) TaxID=1076935 RepID=U4LK41_PYROM|nr:Protein of unknown function [Pyronema omphalodes CBS 100304]
MELTPEKKQRLLNLQPTQVSCAPVAPMKGVSQPTNRAQIAPMIRIPEPIAPPFRAPIAPMMGHTPPVRADQSDTDMQGQKLIRRNNFDEKMCQLACCGCSNIGEDTDGQGLVKDGKGHWV